MSAKIMNKHGDRLLAYINQLLSKAFFAPLQRNDWLAFHFNQPFLLGLGDEEFKHLVMRCILAAWRLSPGKNPSGHDSAPHEQALLIFLRSASPAKILAHALAGLKDERPFLFHSALAKISALKDLDPDKFASLEELLEKALSSRNELSRDAAREIAYLRGQVCSLLENPPLVQARKQVEKVLGKLPAIQNEAQLRLWLSVGDGKVGVPKKILPATVLEAWTAWCQAITDPQNHHEMLLQCQPELRLAPELLLRAIASEAAAMSASCPYCQARNVIAVGQEQITSDRRCPHLVFIGSNDAMHLLRVLLLAGADIGADTLRLLDSYYQSPDDLSIFANIISDLYQMLLGRGRIGEVLLTPAAPAHNPLEYLYLYAYFSETRATSPEDEA
jgi:hypothetical protein